jgi:two-component system NtrC family sensor kinase
MKKILLFLVSFFSLYQSAIARDELQTDSLLSVLRISSEDTDKVQLLIMICREKWKYAEYADAKKYADEALTLSQHLSYVNGIANAYNQIGIVYWYVRENENALAYHQKALAIYHQTGNQQGISEVLNRIGHDYADMPDYQKALDYFQQALELNRQLNDEDGVAKNMDLIGYVHMNLSDFSAALDYYFKALTLSEKIGSIRGVSAVSHDIAVVYEKQNNLNEALKFASRGLALALKIGEQHLIEEAYEGLEKIYLKMHKYEEAYAIRLKYDEIEMVLRSADNAGRIKQMQMQYEFDKKQVSDSLRIAQEKEIAEIKLQKQKAYTYGGLSGIVIAIILLFFVYRNYKKQRIANQKLQKTQEQLIKSEKMAAFGLMATRVSHEIQNPLNFVINFSELSSSLIKDVIESPSEKDKKENVAILKENNEKINEHGKRAASIIKQLQEHSLKGTAHEFFEEN